MANGEGEASMMTYGDQQQGAFRDLWTRLAANRALPVHDRPHSFEPDECRLCGQRGQATVPQPALCRHCQQVRQNYARIVNVLLQCKPSHVWGMIEVLACADIGGRVAIKLGLVGDELVALTDWTIVLVHDNGTTSVTSTTTGRTDSFILGLRARSAGLAVAAMA